MVDEKRPRFYQKTPEFVRVEQLLSIEQFELGEQQQQRLWLSRDYEQLLAEQANENESLFKVSCRLGEISFTQWSEAANYAYNPQLGLFKI